MKKIESVQKEKILGIVLFLVLSLGLIDGVYSKTLVGSRNSVSTYIKTASDGISLRSLRKVGVGMSFAGVSGTAGADIEMNFAPDISGFIGFGFAENFQTFTLKLKKYIAGGAFMPYVAAGYSRWYTTSVNGPMSKTSPEVLAQKFLSDKELREGKFAENFLFPAAGVQYMQLGGEYAGTTVYAEVLIMLDIDDFVAAPVGGIGLQYFF